ncbi:MAG: alanine racemase [Bacillota bacterium]|jgi:alanine racemase|nr:alanine racemase [Bacillota bacterium]MDK2856455.1 alanine racemase [Bacillota bacterium]MDK2926041.1 alanine racemase [Bacillota bacterium]
MGLRPTWAEIDLRAFAANLRAVKDLVGPQVKVMAVVKANAYGHGAVRLAQVAAANGADQLAVATLDEAVTLREAGLKLPILVLGTSIPGEGAEVAVELGIAQALCTVELAEALSAAARRRGKEALVHLKIDTGMSRIGVRPHEAVPFMERVGRLPGLRFEGIFSHFAASDEPENPYTELQFSRFQEALKALREAGYTFPLRHIANSAAILDHPEMHLDMVRPGCILFGSWPSEKTQRKISIKPTLTLKTRIVFLKRVPAGTPVSYGLTYTAPSERLLATLPIGYADGYRRGLSNKASVLIRGMRAPVVGRVCMDQCVVDVTDVPGVTLGDEVVLIGRQGSEEITAQELADILGTLDLELYCGLSPRVPRLYKE